MMDANLKTWRSAAKVRKQCPHCKRMVEVGDEACYRQFTRVTSVGFMRGGYIGERTNRVTHAYHPNCATELGA